MKTTHTQGPWTTQQIDGVLYIDTVDGDELAMLGPVEGQNRLANGKLMAAAPELLDIMISIANETRCYEAGPRPYSGDSYLPDHFKAGIRAVIAKATA